jgi:hypothetical protein
MATYAENLIAELDRIAAFYAEILAASEIKYVNLSGGGLIFAYPDWGWGDGDEKLEVARMELLRRLRDWTPRFRLLFAHPTPEVAERLKDGIDHLERWLIREGSGDWGLPQTIDAAQDKIRVTVADLRALKNLLPADDYPVRLVVDTNALIDNPDLAAYTNEIGRRYVVHLMPVVLGEIDNLKRAGRPDDLRNNARRADRRLKGLRDNGDVLKGARVAGDVIAKFEHTEPRSDDLPQWLDMDAPFSIMIRRSLWSALIVAGAAGRIRACNIRACNSGEPEISSAPCRDMS